MEIHNPSRFITGASSWWSWAPYTRWASASRSPPNRRWNAFHWHEKTNYAADQIQTELGGSMFYYTERLMVEDCIQRRLDDLEAEIAVQR